MAFNQIFMQNLLTIIKLDPKLYFRFIGKSQTFLAKQYVIPLSELWFDTFMSIIAIYQLIEYSYLLVQFNLINVQLIDVQYIILIPWIILLMFLIYNEHTFSLIVGSTIQSRSIFVVCIGLMNTQWRVYLPPSGESLE